MNGPICRLLRILVWTAMIWTFREVEAQDLQNLPLRKARNALRLYAPGKVPQLQPGFQNGQDVWILYSAHFYHLSGSKQTFLMRKYGLLPVPAKNDKTDPHQTLRNGLATAKAALVLPGQDAKVNNPILDVLSRTQSETSSAVSGTNIVVVYNDDSLFSYGCSFSFSNDGGQSWKQALPSLFPFGYGQGDPVVAAGPNGVIYHAQLATNTFGDDAVAVSKSKDGGATWSLPVNAALSLPGYLEAHDKEWLAVDNSNNTTSGNVYVSWSHFNFNSDTDEILFVRSLDGGRSWSKAKRVGNTSDSSSVVQSSAIAVGPGGEVYVAYYDSKLPGIVVAKSIDGGQSFGEPVQALVHSSIRFGRTLGGGFDVQPSPSIAVDNSSGPNRGTIYIAADIKPSDPADLSDVVLVKSTDGGSKWSPPVRANDDQTATDQFHPSLAVAPDGTLGLMWYDRRNDPQNNVLLDVYLTTSSNGGKSFNPNRRVTSASWMLVPTPFGLRTHYHGDYNQMSSGELGFVLNWADDRSGRDSDIYAAVLPVSEASKQIPDFVLSVDKLAVNELAGGSASLTISLTERNGFSDNVSLESEIAYPGISYQFSPPSLTAGQQSVLSIAVAAGTPPGTYPLSVVGSAGDLRRSVSLRLTVYDGTQVPRVPLAISSAREALLEPKAASDTAGSLHVLFGGQPDRFGAPYGSLQYARFRGNEQLATHTVFRVSDPANGLFNYSIGVDEAGNITMIWLQTNSNTDITNVFLSRSTDQGKTFSPPVNLTGLTDKRMTIYVTLLAVHKSGAINVGYVQDTPPGGPTSSTVDFWFIRSTDGGAKFSTKVNVFETTTKVGFVYSAAMALDPAGNPIFVYDASVGSISTIFDIFLSASKGGTSFQPAVNLSKTSGSNSSAFASDPAIAVDSLGNINAVYRREDFKTSERDVYFTRSVDGGAHFSEPVNATHTANLGIYVLAPSVGTDGSGNIGITWQAFTASLIYPGGLDVFFCQSSDGKAFSSAINISDNIGQVETTPFILVGPNGQMNVLWQDETGGNDQLLALAFGSGVSGPPQQVTAPSNLVVTPDQSGQITLSWTASPEATSYTIKRRSESESEFATIAIGVTSNSFVDTHAQAGETYYYSVVAVNANRESPTSNAASGVPVGSLVLEDKIWLLPTTARSSGLSGSFFTTDVWISNASEASVNLTLEFLRAGGQDNTVPPKTTLALAAHETRLVPNILEGLFGIQSNQFGPIRFTIPGVAADHVAIVSRTMGWLSRLAR
ncbi:MAG: hypothetical protein DMG06_11475 [Acidobacteria bacterium]|nr:MAG: hypothetical protein DMG06_11475 [Acidobacteriota bacterium]